jgi:putative oxidoreductase
LEPGRLRAELGLLTLRLTGLGLALAHGFPKLVALQSGSPAFPESVAALGFQAPLVFAWVAALCEVVGGLGVALGLAARFSAVLAACPLAVAAVLRHHAHDRLLVFVGMRTAGAEALASWGSPELALLYLSAMVTLALTGPGRLSVDALMNVPKGRKR